MASIFGLSSSNFAILSCSDVIKAYCLNSLQGVSLFLSTALRFAPLATSNSIALNFTFAMTMCKAVFFFLIYCINVGAF